MSLNQWSSTPKFTPIRATVGDTRRQARTGRVVRKRRHAWENGTGRQVATGPGRPHKRFCKQQVGGSTPPVGSTENRVTEQQGKGRGHPLSVSPAC
jgi:hypothetical protein